MYIGYTIGSTKDKGGQNDTTKMAQNLAQCAFPPIGGGGLVDY